MAKGVHLYKQDFQELQKGSLDQSEKGLGTLTIHYYGPLTVKRKSVFIETQLGT